MVAAIPVNRLEPPGAARSAFASEQRSPTEPRRIPSSIVISSRYPMKAPPGIAKFDSATAMTLALARFLDGRDFAGLGQSNLLQIATRGGGLLPRRLRERVFATLGAREGLSPRRIGTVKTDGVAEWLAGLYPRRPYPAMMIGSSNGALVHICAALGIPWLPQTFLTLVDQKNVDPDDPVHAMETERETSRRFLAANPNSQLHHLHDPNQDRLMLRLIAYYRSKFLRLPPAYRGFITGHLEPGGTIYLVECNLRWPTTRVADRHHYQFGAVGGATLEEYFHGGPRVGAYLEHHQKHLRRWDPPKPDGESAEAEWGFEAALREDVVAFARTHGFRVVRIVFRDPEDVSPLVADFHRSWHRERGLPGDRLVIESFVVHEPHWVLRTGSAPFWMTFNMEPSLAAVHRYLDVSEPYDEIYLMLFAHGVNSVGLPSIEAWRSVLGRARRHGSFLGLDADDYPAHFSHFARYSQEMRKQIQDRFPLPKPLPIERLERLIESRGAVHGVRLAAE